jgi:hypothetical protein
MDVYTSISTRRLQVVNWKASTVGFHTRASQGNLDLVFASKDIADSITLVIDELLTFDSDHFSLHITVHAKSTLKAKQSPRENKTFPWSPELDKKYHSTTDPLLPAWNDLTDDFLLHVPQNPNTRRTQIHHITQTLTDIIVNSCNTAYPQ